MKKYFYITATLKHFCYLFPILFIAATTVHGIVIRYDVPDSRYLVPESAFPALVDLPGTAHGILIANSGS